MLPFDYIPRAYLSEGYRLSVGYCASTQILSAPEGLNVLIFKRRRR
jgi:hypothetical protein